MKEKYSWIINGLVGGFTVLISLGGFMKLAEEYYKTDLISLVALFTLPAIMGALLSNIDKYKKESRLFLISASLLFTGLFSMISQIIWIESVGSLMVAFGGMIFIFGLLKTTLISITVKN